MSDARNAELTPSGPDLPDESPGPEFETWLADMRAYVLLIARQRVPYDDAEDVAQRVVEKLGRHYARLCSTDSRPYAVTAVNNMMRSDARRARRERTIRDDRVLECSAVPDGAATEEDRERAAVVADACAALPPVTRAVAFGVLVEGISPVDLARTLATTPNAVRQALFRARQVLRNDARVQALCPRSDLRPARAARDVDRWLRELRALLDSPRDASDCAAPVRSAAVSVAGRNVLREAESSSKMLDYMGAASIYGDALCSEGRWGDAARWFGVLAALAAYRGDLPGRAHATVLQGHVFRRCSRSVQALGYYQSGLAMAERVRHAELALMARFGMARVASSQGRLTESGAQLDALLEMGRGQLPLRVRSMMMSDRVALSMRVADHVDDWDQADRLSVSASVLTLEALDLVDGRPTRHQAVAALHDIGMMWMDAGFLDEAIELLEFVYGNTVDVQQRAAAATNLVIASVRRGSEAAFDHWVTICDQTPTSPQFRADWALHAGLGYMAFGRDGAAARALRRSLADARAFGMADVVTRVSEAIRALDAGHGRAAAGWPLSRGPRRAPAPSTIRAMRAALERRLPALQAVVQEVVISRQRKLMPAAMLSSTLK